MYGKDDLFMPLTRDDVGFTEDYYGYYISIGDSIIFKSVGRDFDVSDIYKVFETNLIYLRLSTYYGGRKVECEIERAIIDHIDINRLKGIGFDITYRDIFQLVLSVKEDEFYKKNPMTVCHIGTGWEQLTNKNLSYFDNIPDSGMVYKSYRNVGNLDSKYIGNLDIKPHGSFEEQMSFIKKEVAGNTPCEAALSIGLSAVVTGMLRDILQLQNPIIHFYGDSSRGKTTAAQLAISVAGVPDLQKTSLFFSWNSTANAIISRLKGNRGMPVAMDEVSKYLGSNLTGLIYALSDGRDKERLNKDASLKNTDKSDSFATTIISTGEATLLSKCQQNTGLRARVIEIDEQFTIDAAHANRIKTGCMTYNGFLAPAFADFLNKKDIDYLVDKHKYWAKIYEKNSNITTIKERVSAQYAVILMAADLANEAFQFGFDINKIIKLFCNNESGDLIETDIADIAYKKLLEFTHSNPSHFTRFLHSKTSYGFKNTLNANEIWGRLDLGLNKSIGGKKVVGEIGFTQLAFQNIIKKLGFEDCTVLLKKLKDKGYLNYEKGKLYRKRKLSQDDSTNTRFYVIYEFDDTDYEAAFIELEDDGNPFE